MFFFIGNCFAFQFFSKSDICYKMEELAIENSLVCLLFDIKFLKAAVRKVQALFLESPETLQAHFG